MHIGRLQFRIEVEQQRAITSLPSRTVSVTTRPASSGPTKMRSASTQP
jgi:hypothetical protein